MKRISFYASLGTKATFFALATTIFACFFCEVPLANGISPPDIGDYATAFMSDHSHKPDNKKWMVTYRYDFMKMDGNRNGTDDLTNAEVLANFMVVPTDMTMEMHMFGFMYEVTDRLTVMGMGSYIRKSMNHFTRMHNAFEVKTRGLGDTKLLGLFTIHDDSGRNNAPHRVKDEIRLNIGLSLPTGDIDKRGDTPVGTDQKLPYPMQLGSGTYDPVLLLTWVRNHSDWSVKVGFQSECMLRFGENDEGYRLGNKYETLAWVEKDLNEYASLSLRVNGEIREKIEGRDNELNPQMVPTSRPELSGGKSISGFAELNLNKPQGVFSGNSLSVGIGWPLYQKLDGPQLKSSYSLILSWRLAI